MWALCGLCVDGSQLSDISFGQYSGTVAEHLAGKDSGKDSAAAGRCVISEDGTCALCYATGKHLLGTYLQLVS